MNEAIFGKFYSPTKALSYHRPWILSIGTRSIGKSTGWLIKAIGNWCETGQKFIYVRRTDDEIKITAKTACNNAVDILHQNGYNICSIEARNGGFYAKRVKNTYADITLDFLLNISTKAQITQMLNILYMMNLWLLTVHVIWVVLEIPYKNMITLWNYIKL